MQFVHLCHPRNNRHLHNPTQNFNHLVTNYLAVFNKYIRVTTKNENLVNSYKCRHTMFSHTNFSRINYLHNPRQICKHLQPTILG